MAGPSPIYTSGAVAGIGTSFTPLIALVGCAQPCQLHLVNQDPTNNAFGEIAFAWQGTSPVVWAESLTDLSGPDGSGIPPLGEVYVTIPTSRPLQIRVRGKSAQNTVTMLAEIYAVFPTVQPVRLA